MPLSLDAIHARLPAHSLFAEKSFLFSPEPLRLDKENAVELEKLGYRLQLFQRACNQLYYRSLSGKAPSWVSAYHDAGKPPELLAHARQPGFRSAQPQVIRPDLLLTSEGFAITELDSVPGGIGLTAWLSEAYGSAGYDILGGVDGMLSGFYSVLGSRADILVSEESGTYRPEMQWIAERMKSHTPGVEWRVLSAEDYDPHAASAAPQIYRFFELFDLGNIPAASRIMRAAEEGLIRVTPPLKPWMEEKLWLALFWSHPLREYWRRELSERHFLKLQKMIPQSWVLDPAPIPHHAVIPGLEIGNWGEMAGFSQKQRELVLKVSGFSPQAWGSRGVLIGNDVSATNWAGAIHEALAAFEHSPRVLMRFAQTRIVEHPYFDPATGGVQMMRGRVRLCPYYFSDGEKIQMGGALATIVPSDKKIVHGMRDAILVPVAL